MIDKLLDNAADAIFTRARKEFDALIEAVKKDFFPDPKGLTVDELRAFKPTTQVKDKYGVTWVRQYLLDDAWATTYSSNPATSQNLHDVAGPLTLVSKPGEDEGLFSDQLESLAKGSEVRDSDGIRWKKDNGGWWVSLTTIPGQANRAISTDLRRKRGPITLLQEPETGDLDLASLQPGSHVIDKDGLDWFLVRDRVTGSRWISSTWAWRSTTALLSLAPFTIVKEVK